MAVSGEFRYRLWLRSHRRDFRTESGQENQTPMHWRPAQGVPAVLLSDPDLDTGVQLENRSDTRFVRRLDRRHYEYPTRHVLRRTDKNPVRVWTLHEYRADNPLLFRGHFQARSGW